MATSQNDNKPKRRQNTSWYSRVWSTAKKVLKYHQHLQQHTPYYYLFWVLFGFVTVLTRPFLSPFQCRRFDLSPFWLVAVLTIDHTNEGLWSKWRQVKMATPKRGQKWLYWKKQQTQTTPTVLAWWFTGSSEVYIIDRRLYTYMACNCWVIWKKVQYSIARNTWR